MPAVRKSVSTSAEGVAEASRLRLLLGDETPAAAPVPAVVSPPEIAPSADWSTTLDNIARMSALLREHGEKLAAAEARAERAEARAQEAETWLRRLHQAVLDGLPTARAA